MAFPPHLELSFLVITEVAAVEREVYLPWLVEALDIAPSLARLSLPEQLLGLVVVTAAGWQAKIWHGASLAQQQRLQQQIDLHHQRGLLQPGNWWFFPLSDSMPSSRPEATGYGDPTAYLNEMLANHILGEQDPYSVLADFNYAKTVAEQVNLSFTAVLTWAARHWEQPVWLEYPGGLWANAPARALGWIPEYASGTATATTPQGWSAFQYSVANGLGVIMSQPSPRLRQLESQTLVTLLPAATTLDWITTDFEQDILGLLLPFLGQTHARVVLCLSNPSDLTNFFSRLDEILERQNLDAQVRTQLAQARSEGRLSIRLGVGLSTKYQIALLQDSYGDSLYYYAPQNQPVQTLASWEGDIQEYLQKFEILWNTTADNRVQIIDLTGVLDRYDC